MRNSLALLTEAHQALDDTAHVVTEGANLALDYTMRMIILLRDALKRHAPTGEVGRERCYFDGLPYPCPDVRGVLSVLGVDPDEEPADG